MSELHRPSLTIRFLFFVVVGLLNLNPAVAQESIHGVKMELLIDNLTKKEWRHGRTGAMVNIARYADRPGDHLQVYLDALSEDDEVIRATSASSLGEIGERFPELAPEILPSLQKGLEDPSEMVVQSTLGALKKLGPQARSSLSQIRPLIGSKKDIHTKEVAASASIAVTAGSDEQLEVVLHLMENDPGLVRIDWTKTIKVRDDDPRSLKACVSFFKYLVDLPISQDQCFKTAAFVRSKGRSKVLVTKIEGDLLEFIRRPICYPQARQGENEKAKRLLVVAPLDIQLRIWSAVALAEHSQDSVAELFSILADQLKSKDPVERLVATILIGRVSNHEKAKELLAPVETLKNDQERVVATLAGLTAQRINTSPQGSNYDTQYVYLESPKPDALFPAQKDALNQLKSKIERVKEAIKGSDYQAMICETISPAGVERAIIQSCSRLFGSPFREQQIELFKTLFDSFSPDDWKIVFKEGRPYVPTDNGGVVFRWVGDQWYLQD